MSTPTESRHRALKNRLGAFIHHPVTSLVVVMAIFLSVGLVVLHLLLEPDDPTQEPIEHAQIALTVFFFVELGIKCYVAPSRLRFLAQYWIDIIAVLPWTQSLRVLRVLRLLRVFRVALILSRRVRFVSALFRSAVGEYVVLGLIMVLLLSVGTFALYVSESRAQRARTARRLQRVALGLERVAARLEERPARQELPAGERPSAETLRARIALLSRAIDARRPPPNSSLATARRELEELEALLPSPRDPADETPTNDLGEFQNSFWATLYFLVATEPMINVPTTTVGRVVVLGVMFGGLTTFAIFTGIVTALMVNRLRRRMEIDDMDRFQLNQHIVVCGWNRLVPLIIEEIIEGQGDQSIVVVADLEEAPPEIANSRAGSRVYFVRGDYTKPESLEQARIREARLAIIVADTTINRSDQDRDARTVLSALMIERMSPGIYTCAELLNRDNEQHLRAAGIEEVIVTSEVGGHHLAIAALYSGISEVLSELLTAKVGTTLKKVAVPAAYVGLPYEQALTRYKHEDDALVIGLEVKGQDGPRAPGYAMLVNPRREVALGERDNLVIIAPAREKASA